MSRTRADNVVCLTDVRNRKESERDEQVAEEAAESLRKLRVLASALTFAELAQSAEAEGIDDVPGAYRLAATKVAELYLNELCIPELAQLAATLAVMASQLEKESAS